MFSKLFEKRDKTITHLVKLGDCLARSLRENVSLFEIDSNQNKVSYLTESGKVISGKYSVGKDVMLESISVKDSSVYEEGETLDAFVSDKIHTFVESIHYGEYSSADESFDGILSLWENRLKLSSVQAKLLEKSSNLESLEKIIESKEFQKVLEVSPQLLEFLEENAEKIISVPEIKNAITLSNAVSTAFNFPRLTTEDIEKNKSYILKDGVTSSIYEMICRQELVKRELLESKKNFDMVWATNPSIQKLAGMIFEEDKQVVGALSEALKEVPYLALASKKSLFETFSNCLSQATGIGVTEKDIQKFSSRIFEYKKEVKEHFIQNINEKYGVNIQNLQNPASFKSLANTQVVIFEALSRLSPKGSVLKEVLSEMAQSLKTKSGIECIDVNDFLLEMFQRVGYDEFFDIPTSNAVDFKRVAVETETSISEELQNEAVKDEEYPSDENLDDKKLAAKEAEEAATGTEEEAEEVAPETEEAPEDEEELDMEAPDVPEPVDSSELVGDLADLESMVADIVADIKDKD